MDWLHFLNLQYWYCIIYTFFGGGCTYLEELRAAQNIRAGESQELSASAPSWLEIFFGRSPADIVSGTSSLFEQMGNFFALLWGMYSGLAWFISGFLFFAILSAFLGFIYIRLRDLGMYSTLPPESKKTDPRHTRWEELLEYTKSTDPKLWRESILEADRMLGELLGSLGYAGINTAEKMRLLPEDAFVTVPVAWEAHRIRNFVSSGSSNFILTQREAFRVMKLYEQVFEEFDFI